MTAIERACRIIRPMAEIGDANGFLATGRAIDELAGAFAHDRSARHAALAALDQMIRSMPISSRDSVDFISYVVIYIARKTQEGDDLLARAEDAVRQRMARDPRS